MTGENAKEGHKAGPAPGLVPLAFASALYWSHAAERSSPELDAPFVRVAGIGWLGRDVNSSCVSASVSAKGRKTVQQVP